VNWLVPHPIMQAARPAPSQALALLAGAAGHARRTTKPCVIVIVCPSG
jgi:hypothetical protein